MDGGEERGGEAKSEMAEHGIDVAQEAVDASQRIGVLDPGLDLHDLIGLVEAVLDAAADVLVAQLEQVVHQPAVVLLCRACVCLKSAVLI